ncbi:F-box/WD repeat-containing protein 7 [Larimichthys crocea]|uniref:Uncharacterized protein n=1 Tax=Larimichthys crocea TaxID=215358 RepID=A0ACD3Q5V0_LARCR|nr:F-box/WD repeat-containing protein 7 [Larimichthys crocea]
MDEERQERREEEEEEEEETGRGDEDRTPSRRTEEEEDEEEIEETKAHPKDKARRELIGGHTPISASSSFTSSPFLGRGRGQGGEEDGEEDEVRVAIVTIEDESCPSEPFGTAHLETANQITRIEDGGGKKEEKEEEEEANSDEREEEEEEESTEVTSPSLHLQSQMKRKLDHGPDGRPFPSGKKHCKGNGYLSPSALVQATPTTFGDLRLANGHSAQRRRVTSGPPPSGLQDWLHTFQLALYVLTFLAPKDLLQAAQTCRYWRILAEDNLLWREKCREEGKHGVHEATTEPVCVQSLVFFHL